MAGVLDKVKDKCTEANSGIGIDYRLYMMASPVQYIIDGVLPTAADPGFPFGVALTSDAGTFQWKCMQK